MCKQAKSGEGRALIYVVAFGNDYPFTLELVFSPKRG
jgi:hypothetical protein